MQELQKIEDGFRQIHANTVVSMAQIMALTELVEEVAQRVGVTSIHGLSIKEALRQRTDELSQRLLQGLERPPHPAVKLSVNPLDWPTASTAGK